MLRVKDRQHVVVVVQVSGAFDTVNHEPLLEQLQWSLRCKTTHPDGKIEGCLYRKYGSGVTDM